MLTRAEKKALVFYVGKEGLALSPKKLIPLLKQKGFVVTEDMTLREIVTLVVQRYHETAR